MSYNIKMKTKIAELIEKYKSEIKALENNHKISWDAKTQIMATLREIIFDLENAIKEIEDEKCKDCKSDRSWWNKHEFIF